MRRASAPLWLALLLAIWVPAAHARPGAIITHDALVFAEPDPTSQVVARLKVNPYCAWQHEILDSQVHAPEAVQDEWGEGAPGGEISGPAPVSVPGDLMHHIAEGWVRGRDVRVSAEFAQPFCGRLTGDVKLPRNAQARRHFQLVLHRLRMVSARLGEPLHLNSGYRTRAEQAALYAQFLAGHGAPADPPGVSEHQKGTAADVVIGDADGKNLGSSSRARSLARQAGLRFPHAGEPWHVELR
jgi:hypothetical protein